MDLSAATIYTYDMPAVWSSGRGSNIGIVSFKNMPADSKGATTCTLITTQGAAHGGATGYANTVATNGIGVTCTVIPIENGTAVAGISTRAKFGGTGLLQAPVGITTVTLSPGKDAMDFISFLIYFDAGGASDLSSYKIFVSKNGGFGYGLDGV